MKRSAFSLAGKADLPRRATLALLALAALLAAAWLYARGRTPDAAPLAQAHATAPDAPPEGGDFSATDQDGRPFALSSTRGKVTALFFGFTHCPDVCPLTLAYLEKARAKLTPAQQDQLRLVFVSLDPARDTPARLNSYVRFFGPDITGVFIPQHQLKQVADKYGVLFTKADVKGSENYQIYHSASTFLLGRDGQPRLLYSRVPTPDQIASDLRRILNE